MRIEFNEHSSLDNDDYNDYVISIEDISNKEVHMKAWTLRLPEEMIEWLRIKAARETIRLKKQVSMNTVAVEIFAEAMNSDRKKGGT